MHAAIAPAPHYWPRTGKPGQLCTAREFDFNSYAIILARSAWIAVGCRGKSREINLDLMLIIVSAIVGLDSVNVCSSRLGIAIVAGWRASPELAPKDTRDIYVVGSN